MSFMFESLDVYQKAVGEHPPLNSARPPVLWPLPSSDRSALRPSWDSRRHSSSPRGIAPQNGSSLSTFIVIVSEPSRDAGYNRAPALHGR